MREACEYKRSCSPPRLADIDRRNTRRCQAALQRQEGVARGADLHAIREAGVVAYDPTNLDGRCGRLHVEDREAARLNNTASSV